MMERGELQRRGISHPLLSYFNQSLLNGDTHELSGIGYSEFLHQARPVGFDGT
jgi:hypothetical protein